MSPVEALVTGGNKRNFEIGQNVDPLGYITSFEIIFSGYRYLGCTCTLICFLETLKFNLYISSVGSVAALRTGGRWFDPRFGQYSFRGLMIVIATGFILLSPLSVVSTMVMWETSPWLGKKYCAEYWLKEILESMDGCTGHRDVTKILLKMAFKTIQSINQCVQYCHLVKRCSKQMSDAMS